MGVESAKSARQKHQYHAAERQPVRAVVEKSN
jgi:hypothetical protein